MSDQLIDNNTSISYYETNKLFYNQYVYKITTPNQLAAIFRKNNLKKAKNELDLLQKKLESNMALTVNNFLRTRAITHEDFFTAKNIWLYLTEISNDNIDYRLRIEHPDFSLFTNDERIVDKLSKIVKSNGFCEVWKPNESYKGFLHQNKNVILVDNPPEYHLKVTLKPQNASEFLKWINNNPDKVKAGRTFKNFIKHSGYIYEGLYVYVRDEKILQLISLMGVKFQRVEKLIYKQDLDK